MDFLPEVNPKSRETMNKMTKPHRKEYGMIDDLLMFEDSDQEDEVSDQPAIERRKGLRAESPFFEVMTLMTKSIKHVTTCSITEIPKSLRRVHAKTR